MVSEIAGELARVKSAFAQPTLTLLHQRQAPVVITIFRTAFGRNNNPIPTARLHAQVEEHLDQMRLAGEQDVPDRHGPGGLPALDARPVAGAVARRDGPRGLRADLARAAGARAGEEPRPRPGHAQRAPGRHHPRHRPPLQLRGQPRPDGPRDHPQRGDRPAAGRARPPRRRGRARGRDRGLHARGVHRAAVADLRAAERLRPGRGALRDHPRARSSPRSARRTVRPAR